MPKPHVREQLAQRIAQSALLLITPPAGAHLRPQIPLKLPTEQQPPQRRHREQALQSRGQIARVPRVRDALPHLVGPRGEIADRAFRGEHGLRVGLAGTAGRAAGVAMEGEMGAPTCKAAVEGALAATAAQQRVLSAHHAGDADAQRAVGRVEELVGDGGRGGRVGGRHDDRDARWAARGEGGLVEKLLVGRSGGMAGRTEAGRRAGAVADEEGVEIVVVAREVMPHGGIDDVVVDALEETGL